ncbi:MAG TPA: hypothetical protein VLO30_06045 [Chthoniobacterales bacterium]|nr:hypothetical protein [Chthoniobacterales bacterium]
MVRFPSPQLTRWASTAQVAPHDVVSTDQLTWVKAPMLPELGMDWLVEVTTERFYGPTTLGDPGIHAPRRNSSGSFPDQFLRRVSPPRQRDAARPLA